MKNRVVLGCILLCVYAFASAVYSTHIVFDGYAEYCCMKSSLRMHKGRVPHLKRYPLRDGSWVVVDVIDSFEVLPLVSPWVGERLQLEKSYFVKRCLIENSRHEIFYRLSILSLKEFVYEQLDLYFSENEDANLGGMFKTGIFKIPYYMRIDIVVGLLLGFVALAVATYRSVKNSAPRLRMPVVLFSFIVSILDLFVVFAQIVFFGNVR